MNTDLSLVVWRAYLVALNVSLMRLTNSRFCPTTLPVYPNYAAHKTATVFPKWKSATFPSACRSPVHDWHYMTQTSTNITLKLQFSCKERKVWRVWERKREPDVVQLLDKFKRGSPTRGRDLCPNLTSCVALIKSHNMHTDLNLSLLPSLLFVIVSLSDYDSFFEMYGMHRWNWLAPYECSFQVSYIPHHRLLFAAFVRWHGPVREDPGNAFWHYLTLITALDIHVRELCLCCAMQTVLGNEARQSRVCEGFVQVLAQWHVKGGLLRESLSSCNPGWSYEEKTGADLTHSLLMDKIWQSGNILWLRKCRIETKGFFFHPATPQAMVAKVCLCVAKSCYYMQWVSICGCSLGLPMDCPQACSMIYIKNGSLHPAWVCG